MAVLITLVLGTLGARLVGWLGVDYVDSWPQAIAVGLAAMFVDDRRRALRRRRCGAT